MRVYELAKELGVPNKDLVDKVRGLGIQIANHMSAIEPVDVDRVRHTMVRERQSSLEEVRLNDTVIRRRSKGATVVVSAAAVRHVRDADAATAAAAQAQPPAPPPAPEPPPPPPAPVVVAAPEPDPSLPAPEIQQPVAAAPVPGPAPMPRRKIILDTVALSQAQPTPAGVIPESAAAAHKNGTAEAGAVSPDDTSPGGRDLRTRLPHASVTGSAATGRFIQLPNAPRIEIRDRDEEARKAGRTALRPPAGGRFQRPGGPGPGAPGSRPGGPPRKKQVAVGKKVKQTQITTPAEHKRVLRMGEVISVADFANKIGVKGNDVVKKLWSLGMMGITINQNVDQDTASLLAGEFGWQIESTAFREEEKLANESSDPPESLQPRAPVVTIMGHVDHGKTSLLDAIRKTDVVAGEAGGITQHIGAYRVKAAHGDVVFLDTPGHEAFTAMRSRGAKMTDIVVLVVAADDGPMPQTIEALNHARAAEVPIIVAVNKIDKPGANPAGIRNKMMEHGLVPEELGGDTIFVDVSAKTREGLDRLLEMLAVQSEVLELTANPDKPALGHVVEARLDRSRGPTSTVLVEAGTLKLGDLVVAGTFMGKVRAMMDDRGKPMSIAAPATPVEVLGLDGVPDAGDTFNVVLDEKLAKQIVDNRRQQKRARESVASAGRGISLENILDKIKEGQVKEVKIVLKADVQGSAEAISQALEKLTTASVGVKVISSGVGGITESDITLAKASSAIVIGFNVRPAGKAQPLAEQEAVDIKLYQVIYDAIDDVKKAMVGLLAPVQREKMLGKIEIRQIFDLPKIGMIAGAYVTEGKVTRRARLRLVRDSVVIYTGKVGSLRRFKDDVSEVEKGYECGLTIEGYKDLRENDVIEAFEVEQIAATIESLGAPASP
ncbi:MAG: translation initiation factor IF-2 [Deltaproteobacteria bacterium]|nr:translation initiation factor IF-2 [Deltaproteobacteria bacterium]